jgi:hypothetical protein
MGVDEPQHRAELAGITHGGLCPAARASTPRAVSEEQCWVGVVIRAPQALSTPAWPRAMRVPGSAAALPGLRVCLQSDRPCYSTITTKVHLSWCVGRELRMEG